MREVLKLSPLSGEVTEEIMLRNFPEVTQLLAVDLGFRKKKSYTPDNMFFQFCFVCRDNSKVNPMYPSPCFNN